jgi:hypothetical protein
MSTKEKSTLAVASTAAIAAHYADKIAVVDGDLSIPKTAYESGLALSSLDLQAVERVHQHDANATAAAVLALGNHALAMFPVDSDLTAINGTAKMGTHGQTVNVTVTREREIRNPATGEKTTVHGYTAVTVSAPNAAAIKTARHDVQAAAAAALGGK